jgi:hypothetical protein
MRKAIESGVITRETMQTELSISDQDLTAVLGGEHRLSLARQLCLATLLIERAPALAGNAHTLRSQVMASIALEEGRSTAPGPGRVSWKR